MKILFTLFSSLRRAEGRFNDAFGWFFTNGYKSER